MKIINSKDFYEILLKTDIYSKCFIGLSNPIKICPICSIYFYSKVGDFCPLCKKEKMITKNDFLINFHNLFENSFDGIDLSNGKRRVFKIDDVAYFNNQEEQYFIVNI